MSNTVITNYTDLNGPSTKADSSVVVIVNKDGSLSVDQNLLGTLMGTDGSQSSGISVVRVGHEGKPDDATDSENEDDDKIPHVTLTVDSYYNEPNSIIKYDSGAEMLQSLRIETRENSLVGFHNDHCYTKLTSPAQIVSLPQRERSENIVTYNEPVIQISHAPPPKPVPSTKKITILEQHIIPKGKKIVMKSTDSPIIRKGNEALNKPLPVMVKANELHESDKIADSLKRLEESSESSSTSSSGDSVADRDSDSDYKHQKVTLKLKKTKLKPRILKNVQSAKTGKLDIKSTPKMKLPKKAKKEVKEVKVLHKVVEKKQEEEIDLESLLPTSKIAVNNTTSTKEFNKTVLKQTLKPIKKERKTPAHVTALLSDMTSLFSTPDVIRRVSTDIKTPGKGEKDLPIEPPSTPKVIIIKNQEVSDAKPPESTRMIEINKGKVSRMNVPSKKDNVLLSPANKAKGCDLIPQIDDVSLAQILQDTEGISSPLKAHPIPQLMNSPGLAGPMSPTLDLGLQPTGLEDGLTEDLLLHVAHLVQHSDKLQEVIDTQVLNVETPAKTLVPSPFQQAYSQSLAKSAQKVLQTKEKPIQIVKSDGRVITLPPIEAPATRSSKRKSQIDTAVPATIAEVIRPPVTLTPPQLELTIPEPQLSVSKQYVHKKPPSKKQEMTPEAPTLEKTSAESQESWNSEDDPFRLWCICKQPHNNRFMICCDACEDWFHGKCVNITKAMGQQMEEQGIEWRCPNCVKKTKTTPKSATKTLTAQKKHDSQHSPTEPPKSPLLSENMLDTNCIVCKKSARSSSIYCSNTCILKHAHDSLGMQIAKSEAEGKPYQKPKSDIRVIVYERKSGRLLAGPNAPTAGDLKSWLQKNPTFEVVRPGALSSIKPGMKKKIAHEPPKKVQTTLNFERVPKHIPEPSSSPVRVPQSDLRDRRLLLSRRENNTPSPRPATPKPNPIQLIDTPKPSTSTAKPMIEPRKLVRSSLNRSLPNEKPATASPVARRKDTQSEAKPKMNSTEPIRDNVRKSLQEQMSLRLKEDKVGRFTAHEIQQFAVDTETELYDLFRDVGMKYKAKYRSLVFNIKDRKNLSLWEKICNKSITPQQLVRLNPEEMASQELSEWRDQESKHQLELIKKSEIDLLAASKTYVLKTHKGEEVMETKQSVSTELDPNVAVEDLVIALNDSIVGEEVTREAVGEMSKPKIEEKKESRSKKRGRDESVMRSKKSRRNSSPAGRRKNRRDSDRKSRSSRRKSEYREKESRSDRRSSRRAEKKSRPRSVSRDRAKRESKEKSDSERSKPRSRSRDKPKRSKSREQSRSASKGRERERSRSAGRSRRRSLSKEDERGRHRSQSKHTSGGEGVDKLLLRSRSQDDSYSKIKTDSTDSDSIERPKSALLKEPHPEYDPHEPMITSAFSEEDLRKSEDAFEDTYKSEILDSGIEYDPTKMFTLDSSIMASTTFDKQDKTAETESDQEPSSTVENAAATIWNGCINMVDVARFYVSAHEVSGSAMDLEEELCAELDIVGRINPETVWDYIGKTKKGTNKDIDLLRLQAANDEEKMQYIALYSYLSSRNRLGVVKVPNSTTIKDFYIIPLPANTSLPSVLLPLNGPGLGDPKTHLLIAVIIRQRKKRLVPNIPKDIVPAKVGRESRKRSYTPPVVGKSSYTPPTSPRRRALPLPTYPSSALSTSVKDKIAASLARAEEGDEAYSPGGSSTSSNSAPAVLAPSASAAPGAAASVLRTKMEELNRQIEEQKQQIMKMAQADSSVAGDEDEAYSPSRPMTPPPTVSTLADIALPSNLHEILANIKQQSGNQPTDVDMRNLPLS